MSKEKQLSPKQKRFVEEYLIDLNAIQAAIRAGYTEKGAHTTSWRMITNPSIAKEIQRAMKERSERTAITQDRVIQEIARIGFSDPRRLFDATGEMRSIQDLDDDTAAAIAGIDVSVSNDGILTKKIKLWDKNSALEKLAKHLQLFTEKVGLEVSKPINVNVSGPGFPPAPASIFEWEQQMKEYIKNQKARDTAGATDNEDDEK
jgi:phage terminase small subunit